MEGGRVRLLSAPVRVIIGVVAGLIFILSTKKVSELHDFFALFLMFLTHKLSLVHDASRLPNQLRRGAAYTCINCKYRGAKMGNGTSCPKAIAVLHTPRNLLRLDDSEVLLSNQAATVGRGFRGNETFFVRHPANAGIVMPRHLAIWPSSRVSQSHMRYLWYFLSHSAVSAR